MRTREQIIADCEKRFEELRAEKERIDSDPLAQYPCRTCRWFSSKGTDGFDWSNHYADKYGTCTQPLVKGFDRWGKLAKSNPMPCGRDKALWEAEPTVIERTLAFFGLLD